MTINNEIMRLAEGDIRYGFFSHEDNGKSQTLILTNEASLDSRYAYYWFLKEQTRHEVRQLVKGIHLYPKDVARLQIPFPPLEELSS